VVPLIRAEFSLKEVRFTAIVWRSFQKEKKKRVGRKKLQRKNLRRKVWDFRCGELGFPLLRHTRFQSRIIRKKKKEKGDGIKEQRSQGDRSGKDVTSRPGRLLKSVSDDNKKSRRENEEGIKSRKSPVKGRTSRWQRQLGFEVLRDGFYPCPPLPVNQRLRRNKKGKTGKEKRRVQGRGQEEEGFMKKIETLLQGANSGTKKKRKMKEEEREQELK